MTDLYLIFGAGLLGVLGHWVTRWSQGRTQSTFIEYLSAYRANTLSSVFANLFSSATIYSATPEDIGGRALALVVLGAYAAGYTLDSKINKDKSTSEALMQEKLEAMQRENAKVQPQTAKSRLAEILAEDDALGR
jgi:hypothetical protein